MNLKAARQRVADLRGELAAAKKQQSDLSMGAITEKRALKDEERTKIAEAKAAVDALQAQLTDAEQALVAAEAANEADRPAAAGGRVVPDLDRAAAVAAARAAGLTIIEDGLDKAARAPGHFGRQMLAVRKAAMVAKGHDEVMTSDDRQLLRQMQAAATGLTSDVPSDGGFLVVQERSNQILQRAYSTGQILSRVNRMPIGANSNGMKLPAIDETSRADGSRYGGIVSSWLGQGNAITSGKPKFRELDMKLRKVGAFVYTTDEMLMDAVALEAWINKYLPLELQFRAEDAVVNGLGGNQPLGILQSPGLITVTRAGASHVTYDDVSGMWKRMWAPLRQSAAWFVDQSGEQHLEQMNFVSGTGGGLAPIYKAAGTLPGQVYAEIYGRPVIPVEYCANLGTKGDIILAALDEYVVIDKGGVDQAVSLHVAFLTDEAVYRFMYRVDGQLTWQSALTPKSGGSTLSPAVVLST